MALVALTDDQKISLQSFQRFKDLVSKALTRKAQFWQGVDPTNAATIATLGGHTRWRKSISYSFSFTQHPAYADDSEFVRMAIVFLGNTAAWDNVANTPDACCTQLIANTNAQIDSIADNIFDEKIKTSL